MQKENHITALLEGHLAVDAKSKIILAALEEFGMNSLAAARTRHIAKKAGVNHAAISYYFGGKDELYKELARQIAEFINYYDRIYFEKFEEVKKSKSASDAKNLILEILRSRMCIEDSSSEMLRNIIMLIMREELASSEIFDMLYERAFNPISTMMGGLVEIGSNYKYKGEAAHIIAKMLMGQVHLFNNARTGIKRSMGWKSFDKKAADKVAKVNAEIVEKILA